jgi:hypothetical protein
MKTSEPVIPAVSELPSVAPGPSPSEGPGVAPEPRPGRVGRRLDLLLAGGALALAFLVSSFVARNSDLWLHLAGGRLLAQGRFQVGVDPFAYTTRGIYWAHHVWLFDLLLYGLYGLVGGAGLVVLKALLVTALAGLLLGVRRPGGPPGLSRRSPPAGGWPPTVCTTLAVLAMSPGLLLQPACLSLFFLGLTFWLLWRPHAREDMGIAAPPAGSRDGIRHVCLLLLFVLWVNLDSWFLLGPLLVALFWMGERLPVRVPSDRPTPAWLLPAAVAACLFSPHHWHAFSLPAELSPVPAAAGLWRDVRFSSQFASPWQLAPQTLRAINLAAWAYFVLTGLGLVSFVLNRRELRGWRLLVWGGFGLLGAWQVQAVPFFAVVAAPITALNLQDWLSRRSTVSRGTDGGLRRWSVVGRMGLLGGGLLLLLLLAWPGWLQGFGNGARRVGWGVQPDPSLQRVAETIRRWRQEGRLGDGDHAFAFHPDIAHYCAWFCPEERAFFDQPFPLFPQAAREFEDVCRALNPARTAGVNPAAHPGERAAGVNPAVWQRVFREWGITYLVLDDPDTFSGLLQDPRHWVLLHVGGRAAIFGWREEAGRTYPVAAAPLDVNRLAFSAGGKDEGPFLPPAPDHGPGRDPQAPDLWARFSRATPPPAVESDAATLYLRYFRARVLPQHPQRLAICWASYAAGLAGLPAAPGAAVPLLARLQRPSLFLGDSERDLAAPPLLAVRLARRALAANPEDATAYLRLAQAYLALHYLTGERSPANPLPLLAELRQVQVATALRQALIRDPDLETAHQLLANLYAERGYLDATLHHRREELRLARGAGPGSDRRLEGLAKQVGDLEQVVQNRQKTWAIASRTRTPPDPVADAEAALRLGLARTALDEVLLPAPQALLGGDGVRLEFLLALQLGRAEEIRGPLLAPEAWENKRNLGTLDVRAQGPPGSGPAYRLPAYDWLVLLLAAAAGDYDLADGRVQDLAGQVQAQQDRNLRVVRQHLPAAVAAEVGMGSTPLPPLSWLPRRIEREEGVQILLLTGILEGQRAELNLLGGMLSLERGLPRTAEDYLRKAVHQRTPDAGAGVAIAGRPLAETYLRRIREAEPARYTQRGGS